MKNKKLTTPCAQDFTLKSLILFPPSMLLFGPICLLITQILHENSLNSLHLSIVPKISSLYILLENNAFLFHLVYLFRPIRLCFWPTLPPSMTHSFIWTPRVGIYFQFIPCTQYGQQKSNEIGGIMEKLITAWQQDLIGVIIHLV